MPNPEPTTEPMVTDAVVRVAEIAIESVAPTCGVCGIEYIPGFSGACAEPLGPLYDGSRVCGGSVGITAADQARAAARAVAVALSAPSDTGEADR
jgi:hypothetical protein